MNNQTYIATMADNKSYIVVCSSFGDAEKLAKSKAYVNDTSEEVKNIKLSKSLNSDNKLDDGVDIVGSLL